SGVLLTLSINELVCLFYRKTQSLLKCKAGEGGIGLKLQHHLAYGRNCQMAGYFPGQCSTHTVRDGYQRSARTLLERERVTNQRLGVGGYPSPGRAQIGN